MNRILNTLLLGAALLLSINTFAQPTKKDIRKDPRQSGCFYLSYPMLSTTKNSDIRFGSDEKSMTDDGKCIPMTALMNNARPAGYEPFYISHYGRHGSRWISKQKIYDRVSDLMEKAAGQTDGISLDKNQKGLSENDKNPKGLSGNTQTKTVLNKKGNALTAKGIELLKKIRIITADAEGRAGELSPKGVREHRGIAERMYWNYPEIFNTDGKEKNGSSTPIEKKVVKIDSRSTRYTRCIYSMIAFDERLKELNPELQITRTSHEKDVAYLANYKFTDETYELAGDVADSLAKEWIRPDRFLKSIFSKDFIRKNIPEPEMTMFDFFHVASDLQATDHLGIDLYSYFTTKELYMMWKVLNAQTYIKKGPSLRFGEGCVANAGPLLENIVTTADKVISGECDDAATLRFGHESNLLPLLAMMQVEGASTRTTPEKAHEVWSVSDITPMAANLQLIFFRPVSAPGTSTEDGAAAGAPTEDGAAPEAPTEDRAAPGASTEDGAAPEAPTEDGAGRGIKVRVLHNEHDAHLPIEGYPFYDWTTLRTFLMEQYRYK